MATSYAEHTVALGEGQRMGSNTTKTFKSAAYSIPDGEKFYQFKIINSQGYGSTMALQGAAGNLGWNKWSSDKSIINWTNGNTASVSVSNGTGGTATITVKVVFKTTYKKVVAGNIIKATDRSKSGTTTKAGNIITGQDMSSSIAFTKGDKITASKFNSTYGYVS